MTYVIKALMKSEGEEAEEASLDRIEMRRSSGKESKKSDLEEKRFLLKELEE